jgi:hypothetical protein
VNVFVAAEVTRRTHPCSRASTPLRRWLRAFVFSWLLLAFTGSTAEVRCLPSAHAHNDYLHARPLLDALEHGFCSVEADIHLVDGRLLVAHDADKVDPARTLERLYLDPLKARFSKRPKAEFFLMIDFKTEAESTYVALRKTLKNYSEILTVFRPNSIETNAVSIVISGNRPISTISNESVRYVAIDGRLPDLETKPLLTLVPWISDNWTKHFTWRGESPISPQERARLRWWVQQAHEQGRKIRFWAIPDNRNGWAELRSAGVDLINTDNLAGLRDFLIFENTN